MEIIKKSGRYEMLIKNDATWEEYSIVINYLIKKLQLKKDEVQEINDFDSYYYKFFYSENKIVLSYSNFFGISVYFFDNNINSDVQKKVLKSLSEVLSEIPF